MGQAGNRRSVILGLFIALALVGCALVWLNMRSAFIARPPDFHPGDRATAGADEVVLTDSLVETTRQRGSLHDDAALADITGTSVSGRVLDITGRPVPNCEVGIAGGDTFPWSLRDVVLTTTDGTGTFVCALRPPATLVGRTGSMTTLIAARVDSVPIEPVTLVLGKVVVVGGCVVDEARNPVVGARIEYLVTSECIARLGSGVDRAMMFPNTFCVSDAHGRFAFDGLIAIPGARLETTSPGFRSQSDAVPDSSTGSFEIVLALSGTGGDLRAIVRDEAGVPLPDASVRIALTAATSDGLGAFTIAVPDQLSPGVQLVVVRTGYVPRIIRAPELRSLLAARGPEPVSIVLRGPALSIEGIVRSGNGGNLTDWRVSLLDPTPLIGEWSSAGWIENDGNPQVRVDPEGRFRIDGLDDRLYDIIAFDSASLVSVRGLDVPAGRRDVELRVDDDAWLEFVAGRVTSLDGHALAGVRVRQILVTTTDGKAKEITGWLTGSKYSFGKSAVTDEEGAFRLEHVPRGPLQFSLEGDAILPAVVFAMEGADPSALRLAVAARKVLRVELGSFWTRSVLFEVLDQSGEKLHVYTLARNQFQSSILYPLESPTSPDLAVSESARVLRLHWSTERIQDIAIAFDAQGVAIVRP